MEITKSGPVFDTKVIGVIGLGYVGLPLAVEFAKRFETRGFDIAAERVRQLRQGIDLTCEIAPDDLRQAARLIFTNDRADLAGSDVFIVTVPTPVDDSNRPDLSALEAACRTVGRMIEKGNTVIVESTLFPGATEDVCVPIIESESQLRLNRDFFVGYSPERISQGDKTRRLKDIVKITSGSTPETLEFVDALYGSIIEAGTHPVASIRIAEAAKVVENTQRDLNIAFANELAMIFERLGLDTEAVLDAAETKWNFSPYRPGLVGGNCINVAPYYLTHKVEQSGYRSDVILSARHINDAMAPYVAKRVLDLMRKAKIQVAGSRILVLGLTFKENCPDVRNTKVLDLVEALRSSQADVDVYDPLAVVGVSSGCGVSLIADPSPGAYDAVILAVAHDKFREMGADKIRAFGKENSVLFDVKHLLPAESVTGRL